MKLSLLVRRIRDNKHWPKIKFICAVVIIVIGIGIILEPWFNALRYDLAKNKIMRTWQNAVTSGNILPDVTTYTAPKTGWGSSVAVISGDDNSNSDIWDEDINPVIDTEYILNNMQGTITIDKINLYTPILNKITEYNLNITVCSVVDNRLMGCAGNYVLAGHNSRIRSRHFNRLDEVEPGDIVILENEDGKYSYLVYEAVIVDPSDVSVMYDDGDRKLLTMITCDNSLQATGRLIVKAEMIEESE